VRNRLETVGDARLDHPASSPPSLINEDLQAACAARPGGTRTSTPACRLRRPARARSSPQPARPGREPPGSTVAAVPLPRGLAKNTRRAGSGRTPSAVPQIRRQLIEQPGHPVLLDVNQGGPVDTCSAAVTAHVDPRPLEDVPAIDLVPQRVEPSPGIGLGRPVKRMLQGTDRIRHSGSTSGGTSHSGTHRAPPRRAVRTDEVAALPSPAVVLSARLKQYYNRLRRPPGTRHFPAETGYRARRSGDNIAGHRTGEGLPSSRRHYLNVPRPIRPGSLAAAPSGPSPRPWPRRAFSGSAPLPPSRAGPLTTLQASLHAADRPVATPKGLSTLGFDPARFQTKPPVCYRAS